MASSTNDTKYAETPQAGKEKVYEGDTVIKASDLKEGSQILVVGGKLTVEGDVTAKNVILRQTAEDRHGNPMRGAGIDIKGSVKGDGASVIGSNVNISGEVSNALLVGAKENLSIASDVSTSTLTAGNRVYAGNITSSKINDAQEIIAGNVTGSELQANTKISAADVSNSKLDISRSQPAFGALPAPDTFAAAEGLKGSIAVSSAQHSDLTAKNVDVGRGAGAGFGNAQSVKIVADSVKIDGNVTQSDIKANTADVGTKDKATTFKANPTYQQSLERLRTSFSEPKTKVTQTNKPSLKERITTAVKNVVASMKEDANRAIKPATPQQQSRSLAALSASSAPPSDAAVQAARQAVQRGGMNPRINTQTNAAPPPSPSVAQQGGGRHRA